MMSRRRISKSLGGDQFIPIPKNLPASNQSIEKGHPYPNFFCFFAGFAEQFSAPMAHCSIGPGYRPNKNTIIGAWEIQK